MSENRIITKQSPVTGEVLGEFPITTDSEIRAAVARAREAFPGWRDLGLPARLQALDRLRGALLAHAEDYARRISLDTGKPLLDSVITELLSVPMFLDHFQKMAPKVLSPQRIRTPPVFPHKRSYVEHFPMGVIGVISPWNFPLQLSIVPILSALVGGNTVVCKPSEVTPITGEVLREIFSAAELPPGVVEVVQGNGATGDALTRADVDKIFFTGSVATGRKVMAAAAEKPIPVELELGGKDAMIVCADAPLKRAARAAVWGGLLNAGQMCISVERIFVVDAVHDAFVEALRAEVARVTVGGPDEDADMGPMTFPRQLDTVRAHLEEARAAGARILSGGEPLDRPGQFFAPTLITHVTPEMRIYREETFGPVLPVIRVADDQEALRLANDHVYGLSGSVWTTDLARGRRLASALECGQVMINDLVTSVGNPALPFGGVKSSGFGRYHGPEGLLAFQHTKAIMVDPGKAPAEPFWFPYEGKYADALEAFRLLAQGKLLRALGPMRRLTKKTNRK